MLLLLCLCCGRLLSVLFRVAVLCRVLSCAWCLRVFCAMCSEERHSDAIWMAWMQRVEAKRLASWDTHGMKWERSSGLVCRRAVEPCASCMSWCGAAYRGVAGEAQALQSASAPYGWRRSIGGLFCVLRGRGRRARTYKNSDRVLDRVKVYTGHRVPTRRSDFQCTTSTTVGVYDPLRP